MKSRYLIAVMIAGVIILVMSAIVFFAKPGKGDLAPVFSLKDGQGNIYNLSDYRGKTVFLHFWAPWCGTCLAEIPAVEKFYNENKDMIVLTILVDDDGASIGELKRRTPMSYPVLIDPDGEVADKYKVWGVPETFIIDKDGIIETKTTEPLRP